MSVSWLEHLGCCGSYDELSDIASTIQAYTSIHFENEDWIKIRFFLMLYSCIIFIWTIIDSIFSDRTLFYFIYATHWILLLSVMLYLICSYVITLVIYERISSPNGNGIDSKMHNNEVQKKNFEDIPLEESSGEIPSLSELGLYKWNKFIVFLQNASLAPSIMFPVIFWFVIYPNIDSRNTTIYDGMLEFHIHCIIPILILFDFIFSSRCALYIDMYQPLIVGILYCLWTYLIFIGTDNRSMDRTLLYLAYYDFEVNDFMLWFVLNLSILCGVHLIFCLIKSKVLSKHFVSIKLSTNHMVVIDKNGNIVSSKQKQYDPLNKNNKKRRKNKKSKKKKNKVKPAVLGIVSDVERNRRSAIEDNIEKKRKETHKKTKKTQPEKAIKKKEIEIAKNEQNKEEYVISAAGNSIKEGFKNLIAIIEPNKNENKSDRKYYKQQQCAADYSLTTTDSNTDDDDDDEDSDSLNDDEDDDARRRMLNYNAGVQRFYSLKSDMMTSDDEDNGFSALKTKSLQTILNLSKKLHTVSVVQRCSYKSEVSIEYDEQETSEYDDSAALGLKSGLYKF